MQGDAPPHRPCVAIPWGQVYMKALLLLFIYLFIYLLIFVLPPVVTSMHDVMVSAPNYETAGSWFESKPGCRCPVLPSQKDLSTFPSHELCGRTLGLLHSWLSLSKTALYAGSTYGKRVTCAYSMSLRCRTVQAFCGQSVGVHPWLEKFFCLRIS